MSQLAQFREIGKKIVCVGRNYRDLAAEMGNPIPTKPLVFLKPTTSYITEGQAIKIPKGCNDFIHEVELGVVIGTRAFNVSESEALKYVGGYVLSLDMTARDFQTEAKKNGFPWAMSKSFDTACPVSDFIEKEKIPDPDNVDIWLKVNGELRQSGNTKNMIFSVEHLISYTSQYFTLEPGDLFLTGTPAGVSKLNPGDVMQAGLGVQNNNLVVMEFKVES